MTIENLKQIAIKYATTKGSRVPLAPDELCNAVVQYFNEFLKITADINTIQVAVTEEGGNIVFTITGNTLDGKAFTPIVITVDHNDFVTNQEFEEFKTTTNAAIQKNTESINSLSFRVEDTENDITTIQVQVGQINTRVGNTETDVRNLKNRVNNTETNIAEINSTLDNKLDKNTSETQFSQVYIKLANGGQEFLNISPSTSAYSIPQRSNIGRIYAEKGAAGDPSSVATMSNIADVEAKIPDVSNFATTEDIPSYTDVYSVSYDTTNGAIIAYDGAHEIHIPLQAGENVTIDASEDNKKIVISAAGGGGTGDVTASGNNTFTGVNMFNGQILGFGPDTPFGSNNGNNTVLISNDTTNGYIIKISSGNNYISIVNQYIEIKYDTYYMQLTPIGINFSNTENNANNIIKFSPVQSQGDLTLNMPSKTGEHTLATTDDIPDTSSFVKLADDNTFTGNNTFTGENTFNNSIYAKNSIVAGDTTNYGANSVTKGSNTYSFPNKSGTFAMTNDIINEPIYFISFYANEPSEPCHLIGTMMSKNSYGTGQKTNEEFAVMLADNLYTNSNEGLAAYGKLANKDILCIYSEDGLSIRCLNEENSEVDLPTVMFFVMETEL